MITKVSVVTGATATLLSAAKKRCFFFIQNNSLVDSVFIAIDGSSNVTASAGARPGIKLLPGEHLSSFGNLRLAQATDKDFYGISESANPVSVSIQEY